MMFTKDEYPAQVIFNLCSQEFVLRDNEGQLVYLFN